MSSDNLEERQKEIQNQWNNVVSYINNPKLLVCLRIHYLMGCFSLDLVVK